MLMTYGDISPRTAGYVVADLLKRGLPLLILEKFGQMKTLPANKTKSMIFRRYEALALATTPLTEGVTPVGQKLTKTDVTVTLEQYGDYVPITDVIEDTHEDPILQESTSILGEQAAQTIETIRFNVLKAGTNKFYGGGAAGRDTTVKAMSDALLKKIIRALKRQNAMMMTKVVKSTPAYGTQAILPAFICVAHTDCEGDIRALTNFIDAKNYGNTEPFEGEIGSVGNVRFVISNIFTSYADAGGAKGSMISTTGVSADIYPYIFIARDSWAGVALKGKFAISPAVVNPKPSVSDPLGQRGSVGWKTMQGAVILNDAWLAVAECAASEITVS